MGGDEHLDLVIEIDEPTFPGSCAEVRRDAAWTEIRAARARHASR